MLDFDQPHMMLHPSTSPSSLGPSPLDMFAAYDQTTNKVNTGHLLVRQPHAIQIIQLVEGPPPPPRVRRRLSPSDMTRDSSSASSSSDSYPSTSEDEEDDEEEECSSYCSSVVTPEDDSSSSAAARVTWTDDTYDVRMKRIHDWRDGFVKATMGGACALPDSRSSSLKRKMNQHQMEDDVASHTSKRSRSRDGQGVSRLTGYPCPACDTPFPTRQSLQKHGLTPHVPEACRIAVEYNLE